MTRRAQLFQRAVVSGSLRQGSWSQAAFSCWSRLRSVSNAVGSTLVSYPPPALLRDADEIKVMRMTSILA